MSNKLTKEMTSLFLVNKLTKKRAKIIAQIDNLQLQRAGLDSEIQALLHESGVLGKTTAVVPATSVLKININHQKPAPLRAAIKNILKESYPLKIGDIAKMVGRPYPAIYQTIVNHPDFVRNESGQFSLKS